MSRSHALEAHLASARPRALAALVRRFRDIEIAEDAFQDAALRALKNWEMALPDDPAAWLIRAGSNAAIDRMRRIARQVPYAAEDLPERDEADVENERLEAIDTADMRDDVLRLLFMCCHPDLTVEDQLALALKVVGGFTVAQIADAFVVKPKTMEQRITRAKKKAAGVAERLETPTAFERSRRLEAVELMIYLMFNEGYAASRGDEYVKAEICEEAIRLARLLLSLFPSQPEVMGLLALCLAQHSRRRGRTGSDGDLVPLDRQDRSLWDRAMIREAGVLVEKALRTGRPGAYQIQAAIAVVHCQAKTAEDTDWREIELLYRALAEVMPTPVVALNHAVAIWKAHGPEAALSHIAPLESDLAGYLPYHVAKAEFLAAAKRNAEAAAAFEAALSLQPGAAQSAHIRGRIASLATA